MTSANLWWKGNVSVSYRVICEVLTSLNCIDGSVGERTHCAGYETDQHVLIRWELSDIGLEAGCQLFELLVCSEVDTYCPVSAGR